MSIDINLKKLGEVTDEINIFDQVGFDYSPFTTRLYLLLNKNVNKKDQPREIIEALLDVFVWDINVKFSVDPDKIMSFGKRIYFEVYSNN